MLRSGVRRRHGRTEEEVADFIADLSNQAIVIETSDRLQVVRDEDDNRVLEAALEAGADYIVSGDEDLLTIAEYEGVRILSASGFVAVLQGS